MLLKKKKFSLPTLSELFCHVTLNRDIFLFGLNSIRSRELPQTFDRRSECCVCREKEPPILVQFEIVEWVACELCAYWVHTGICMPVPRANEKFWCDCCRMEDWFLHLVFINFFFVLFFCVCQLNYCLKFLVLLVLVY